MSSGKKIKRVKEKFHKDILEKWNTPPTPSRKGTGKKIS
jgi:hypothetical protein